MAIINKKREEKKAEPSIKEAVAWRVVEGPHISEKATYLEEEDRYIFRVNDSANKIEIKKAMKELYGAEPLSVNIINIPRKEKRLGRHRGWKKGYKKAIVQFKKGTKID